MTKQRKIDLEELSITDLIELKNLCSEKMKSYYYAAKLNNEEISNHGEIMNKKWMSRLISVEAHLAKRIKNINWD